MRMNFRGTILSLVGLGALAMVGLVGMPMLKAKPIVPAEIAAMHFPPYEAQRVVYHVTEGEWFFQRRFRNILHVARNHTSVVAFGDLDLRILLQGGGIDLLRQAKSDMALAAEIDTLKTAGVRFLVCRNTLLFNGIDPGATLHGVKPEDIVSSSMAEAASLIAKGHVYLKM
ncbi:MAG: DsrE family protein [Bosea sp. (in: a-proteobacteria)]